MCLIRGPLLINIHNRHYLSYHANIMRHFRLILVILLSIAHHVTSNSNAQNLNSDLESFKITWNGPLVASDDTLNVDNDNVINIATKHNERYMCIVPSDNKDQLNFDTSAKNSSSDTKVKSPIQLLEPLLKGNYCSYKFELFWIYELCHGKFLRQYHEEIAKYKAKVTQEYYLGRMEQEQIKLHEEEEATREQESSSAKSRPTVLVNGHYKPYVMFNMTSGTKCDLTKKDRMSRIVYVCNDEPSLEIYSIKEISTCEYEAIVLSPHLCQHKDFKIDTTTQHDIKCYSLDGAPRRLKLPGQEE